jgi:hypothetical protein
MQTKGFHQKKLRIFPGKKRNDFWVNMKKRFFQLSRLPFQGDCRFSPNFFFWLLNKVIRFLG